MYLSFSHTPFNKNDKDNRIKGAAILGFQIPPAYSLMPKFNKTIKIMLGI